MTEAEKNEFLKEEYLKLQDIYEDFDRRALTIKGWAITICLGAIAIGFEKKISSFWMLSGLAALLFWLIEAKWKTYQHANAYRIRTIEGYFRGDKDKKEIVPLQIYNSWFRAYKENPNPHDKSQDSKKSVSPWLRVLKSATLSMVYTPYLYIIIISIVLMLSSFLISF